MPMTICSLQQAERFTRINGHAKQNLTQEFGMKINIRKTKVSSISRKGKIKVKIYTDSQPIE